MSNKQMRNADNRLMIYDATRTEQLVRSMQVAIANLHHAGGGVQGDLLVEAMS